MPCFLSSINKIEELVSKTVLKIAKAFTKVYFFESYEISQKGEEIQNSNELYHFYLSLVLV